MLHATEIIGAETYDSFGNYVGRVKEMFVEPADQPNRVAHLLLSRGQYRPLVARYDQIASVAPGRITLTTDESALTLYQPNEAWLAVGKDLLDQQIIDTNGRKVVRVNDIDLSDQRTNGNTELRITQVDVGLPGAVRRLLQGIVPPMAIRQIQLKLPPRKILWEFVNLVEPDPLRRVKLRLSSQKLEALHPADLADIMEELSPDERQGIISSLDEETAAETIAELDKRLQTQVVEKLDTERAADIIEEMSPDAAADLLASLEPETKNEVLEEMENREAARRRDPPEVRARHRRRHDDHGNRRRRRRSHPRRSRGLHPLPRTLPRSTRQRNPHQQGGRRSPAPSPSRACCSPIPISACPN